MATFTHRQGQFLAFIHLYRRLHQQGPAELDMVKFFRVTPPSVRGMVVKLEELGLITREPGVARSAVWRFLKARFRLWRRSKGDPGRRLLQS
jgi:repressor LexA